MGLGEEFGAMGQRKSPSINEASKKRLKEKLRQWRSMKNNREEAECFYYREIFPFVIDAFKKKAVGLSKYRYLISLVGFSPQPIILFIKGVEPEKTLFICSPQTESIIDTIWDYTDLRPSSLDKCTIESSDVPGVYHAIKDFVYGKEPKEILIDTTGGKKSMVGAASMAGNFLRIDVGYVDYDNYITELRQPEPCTEFPNILKNPLVVFGDLQIMHANELFNQGNYQRVREIAMELEDKVEDVWRVRRLLELAEIYQAWQDFRFEEALKGMDRFLHRYEATDPGIPRSDLEKHQRLLKILANENDTRYPIYLAVNFYFAGVRLSSQGRYDIAVLLMYRTMEQVTSLFLKEKGIDPQKPSYPKEVTEDIYNKKLKEIYGNQFYAKELPTKIAFMDQVALLLIMKHPLTKASDPRVLKGVVNLRNNNMLVHGYYPQEEADYNKIRREAAKLLGRALELKGMERLNEQEKLFSFPQL